MIIYIKSFFYFFISGFKMRTGIIFTVIRQMNALKVASIHRFYSQGVSWTIAIFIMQVSKAIMS